MRRFAFVAAVVAGLMAATASSALASHSWGPYHWSRSANPFTVPLGDSATNTAYSNWDGALGGASVDWTASSVLDSPIVAVGGNAKQCSAQTGRIRVCNSTYGFNGWLGLAQIWLSGSHIVRATAKMNDSYFNSSAYSFTAPVKVTRSDRIRSSYIVQDYGDGYSVHTLITWAL